MLGARIGARRPAIATFTLVTWLLLFPEISTAAAVQTRTLDSSLREESSARALARGNRRRLAIANPLGDRRLLQYTGAVVAGSEPIRTAPPEPIPSTGYAEAASAPNPAIGVLDEAMATGRAPSDIVSARGHGWVRGKIMGQHVDASVRATANIGHNQHGGVTGVARAYGQFKTEGPYGYAGGQGQASAGAITMQAQDNNGDTVMHGAAAAQASGSIYGGLPTGTRFYGRGSASAQAEGTLYVTSTGRAPKGSQRVANGALVRG